MKDSASDNLCSRAEDLVTYLYGEATQKEALDFELHLKQCASCSVEFATFGEIRGAVGEWREQMFGLFPSPSLESEAAQPTLVAAAPERGRSAIAALREFFALSPMWMRAATAMAALIFCALATIAVAYFVQQPKTVVVQTPVKTGYSEEEMRAEIAKALKKQDELREGTASAPLAAGPVAPVDKGVAQTQPKGQVSHTAKKRQQKVVPGNVPQPSEAEVLASSDYLPFTAPGSEDKLPTLSDLVDDNED